MRPVFEIKEQPGSSIVQPVLFFRIGERYCSFAITDNSAGQLTRLAWYAAEEVDGNFLGELLILHPELNQPFYQVQVCYDYPQSMLIPATGFRHEDAGQLKGLLPASTVTVTEMLPEWQLFNVYAVPKGVYEWINRQFPSAGTWHQASVSLRNNETTTAGCLRVDFRKHDFTLLATRSHQLLLSQTFEYSTPEDVIYFLLKTCQQFVLSQNEVKLELSGLVDRQSALYKELYQYFIHIDFRDAAWRSNKEHPAHFFTSLNDLSKCVS
ncbi:MAG: DUF3822 family protein [Bacteroidota bacterium]